MTTAGANRQTTAVADQQTTAVVFAYHNVGVRCLRVLLDQGVRIPLVLTHEDSPTETIWYDSVAAVCAEHGIETLTVDDPNHRDVLTRIRALAPDFFFSFYYRKMLGAELLAIPRRGALNSYESPHLTSVFRKQGWKVGDLPNTELIANSTLTLPLHAGLQVEDVDFVCDSLQSVLNTAKR